MSLHDELYPEKHQPVKIQLTIGQPAIYSFPNKVSLKVGDLVSMDSQGNIVKSVPGETSIGQVLNLSKDGTIANISVRNYI